MLKMSYISHQESDRQYGTYKGSSNWTKRRRIAYNTHLPSCIVYTEPTWHKNWWRCNVQPPDGNYCFNAATTGQHANCNLLILYFTLILTFKFILIFLTRFLYTLIFVTCNRKLISKLNYTVYYRYKISITRFVFARLRTRVWDLIGFHAEVCGTLEAGTGIYLHCHLFTFTNRINNRPTILSGNKFSFNWIVYTTEYWGNNALWVYNVEFITT